MKRTVILVVKLEIQHEDHSDASIYTDDVEFRIADRMQQFLWGFQPPTMFDTDIHNNGVSVLVPR